MKHKFFARFAAVLLACITMLIFSAPLSVSAEEDFSAVFSDSYAKVGTPMHVEVRNAASDEIAYSWTVDGISVGTDSTYTPTEEDLMKWISVTVTCGSDTATAQMFFSKLPVVYINTENGAEIVSKEDYIDAELIIQGNETYNSDTTTLYNGVTEIRGRGNSTWRQPKKPYKLKLDKKTDVFGMGKNKHWVLLANYLDESLLRNTLAYHLSGEMGMEHMSTVFVDVILNGEFIGNYQFCEQVRVDGTRVDVFDWESFAEDSAGIIADAEGLSKDDTGDLEDAMLEDMGWITSGTVTLQDATYTISAYPDIEIPSINGGYLLELDEYYDEVSKFKTGDNQPIMFKNPEFVNTNSDMMAYVKNYVQAFEDAVTSDGYTATYEGDTLHYSELFDFDSLVDYWVINEIYFNEELNKKSTYMYKDIDDLMYMGPIWDMDWSSGGEGQTYHTEQWSTIYYSTNAQAKNWYKSLIQDPYFFTRAQERYWEIRNDQVADMMEELDANYDLLKESAKANGKKWGYSADYKKYVDDLRNWFNKHLTWMDAQMATQDTLAKSLGYKVGSGLTLSLTDAQGTPLFADLAETAPADALALAGSALKLTIQFSEVTTGNAVLYINGLRTSQTPIQGGTTITVDVPCDSLTAQMGRKNVLEVQIEHGDSTVTASGYVTVVTVDEASCQHEHTRTVAAVAPTCTENGLTEGKLCALCGKVLAEQEEVSASGHTKGNAVTENEVAATCTEKGSWDCVVSCLVCKAELSRETTSVPALGHLWEGIECTRCDAVRENPFTDVPEGKYYINAVLWAVESGITTGETASTFHPDGNCLRGQVVTFLWRAAGSPEPVSSENPFVDVTEGKFYYKAVLWAVENGITNGIDATHFGPTEACTRGQVVTFLYRTMGNPQVQGTKYPFTDVDESRYYFQSMLWAVENGITTGLTTTTFAPNSFCNRAQIVTFLYRTMA